MLFFWFYTSPFSISKTITCVGINLLHVQSWSQASAPNDPISHHSMDGTEKQRCKNYRGSEGTSYLFSKLGYIKTADRNRLGEILNELLLIYDATEEEKQNLDIKKLAHKLAILEERQNRQNVLVQVL